MFVLFGIAFALSGHNPLYAAYNHALAKTFFHKPDIPVEVKTFSAFIWEPLGGTIGGR